VSVLQSAWNFLRWNQQPPRIEQRDVFGVRPLSHQLNRPVWPEENVQTYHDQGYAKLALLFRCIGLLAQSVASAPLAVYQQTIQGDDIIENHPIRQLLVNPNRESNEARMMGQIVMTMSIAGFCVVEKERSTGGRVVGLWPLNPSYCRPIQRQDALPDWEIRVPGYEPVVLQSQDVIALTYADKPNRDPTGIGPMKVLLRETALMNVQTDFLKAFFDSGAMPVYGLVPHPDVASTMTQAQADVIREGWRQRYGGMRGAVEPAVLAGITDVKRLSFQRTGLERLARLARARHLSGVRYSADPGGHAVRTRAQHVCELRGGAPIVLRGHHFADLEPDRRRLCAFAVARFRAATRLLAPLRYVRCAGDAR
jgi:phage portal protein BeeE